MTTAATTVATAISTLVFFARLAPAAAPPADHPLAAMAWCVGGTWVARIGPPDGAPRTAECTFTWADNGRALKYSITLKGPGGTEPHYEGMYFWHPAKKQLALVQVDRDGNVTEAVAKIDGKTMTQENETTQADGTSHPQRVVIEHSSDDLFRFSALVRRNDKWTEAVSLTYERVKPLSPNQP